MQRRGIQWTKGTWRRMAGPDDGTAHNAEGTGETAWSAHLGQQCIAEHGVDSPAKIRPARVTRFTDVQVGNTVSRSAEGTPRRDRAQPRRGRS